MFDMRLQGQRVRVPISPFITSYIQMSCASYYEMPEVKTVLKQKFALVFMGSHMVRIFIYFSKIIIVN
jgi:hypothetical protein